MKRRGPRSGRRRRAVGAGLLLSLLPLATGAQTYSFGSVVVEGNARTPASTILAEAGIAQGEAVSAGELNDASQAIRATGLFETVEVVPQAGTLLIRVREWPTINRIAFEGNARVSDEELQAVVGSIERRVYSPSQAEADTAAIAQAYVNDGRINAVVTPAIIRREDNSVDLVFDIDEGGRTEVERISFVGNRTFSDNRLRSVLTTREAGLLRGVVQADTFTTERVDLDRQVLADFYRSRGFADFSIGNVDVNLTRERDAYLVTYNVREGQRFAFGAVTVSSAVPEADIAAFQRVIRTRPGQRYSPVAIDNDIARIEALALRQGLNFVAVEPRITRDERGLLLDLDYALVRGERVFVERIDIEGNSTTLDRVIRQQFTTVEGDPFNPRAIRETAERIRALGFFEEADVQAAAGSSPDQVVIDVTVVEQPTGSLSFGVNYSTDDGPALVAGFSERNFLGRGQSLDFDLSVGNDTQLFDFGFTEPRCLSRDVAFGLDLAYRTTNNASALYDTDLARFAPSFEFPLTERARVSVLYAGEYTEITDVDEEASAIIQREAAEGGLWTNALGYAYSFDTRRTNIDTPTNYVLRFGQEFGFGETQFIRSTGLAAAETAVLGEDLVLRATMEGGYLDYQAGSSRVTDRFFLGSRYIRGFERQGIGPRDAETGDALGGNAFAVARLEAEFPIGLPPEYGISGGVFVDYGSVWDVGDISPLAGDDVLYDAWTPRAVAGVSIFWTTPLGPLRFNFSEALRSEEFDETTSFDLTVATTF